MIHHRFRLVRYADVSGISGTGDVAEGIQFSDGSVAARWLSKTPCTAIWDSIDALVAVHGHGGRTVVRWLDRDNSAELAFAAACTTTASP